MQEAAIPYVAFLLVAAAGSVVVAGVAWRRRPAPPSTSLAVLALAVAVWQLGYAFELWSVDREIKLAWGKFQYLGIVIIPTAWLAVPLQYTGRKSWLSRRGLLLLSIVPLATLILAWSNEAHGLIWESVTSDTVGSLSILVYTHSPAFWAFAGYSYLLLLAGMIVLGTVVLETPRLYRLQGIALLGSALLPWMVNLAYGLGLPPAPYLDLTPAAFLGSGLLLAWALWRLQMLKTSPIPNRSVFEQLSSGVIVLDRFGRIVDYNRSARRILGNQRLLSVGLSISQLWPDSSNFLGRVAASSNISMDVIGGSSAELLRCEIALSPLYDDHQSHIGHVVMMHPRTELARPMDEFREAEDAIKRLAQDVLQ